MSLYFVKSRALGADGFCMVFGCVGRALRGVLGSLFCCHGDVFVYRLRLTKRVRRVERRERFKEGGSIA